MRARCPEPIRVPLLLAFTELADALAPFSIPKGGESNAVKARPATVIGTIDLVRKPGSTPPWPRRTPRPPGHRREQSIQPHGRWSCRNLEMWREPCDESS